MKPPILDTRHAMAENLFKALDQWRTSWYLQAHTTPLFAWVESQQRMVLCVLAGTSQFFMVAFVENHCMSHLHTAISSPGWQCLTVDLAQCDIKAHGPKKNSISW